MTIARLNSIVPWFGGKRSMAPLIVEELGKHRMFVEPFCGSMAVLLRKAPSSHETVNDLHGLVTNLARVMQSDQLAPILFERLQRTLYCADLFEQSRAIIQAEALLSVDVELAYHYFVASWMGRNGVAGTERVNYQKATRWTPGGGSGPLRFRHAVESIPAWFNRLRNVDILSMDAFELLGKIDDSNGVVVYADPPYLRATRGGTGYEHDFEDAGDGMFAGEDDHARLAEALGRFARARVVLSYYDHPRIRELYRGWTVRVLTRQKNLHVQNRRGAGECAAPEILLINGPSFAALDKKDAS